VRQNVADGDFGAALPQHLEHAQLKRPEKRRESRRFWTENHTEN